MLKNIWPPAFAMSVYVALSLFYFSKPGSLENWYFGDGQDPVQFVWFLAWWPFAVSHHLNPFISNYIWFPRGFNLTWTTSVPTVALLMYPVTVWRGAVFSYNLLSLMAPALSAWTAFLLTRQITRDFAASLVGGYIFGFSTYELGQMYGHLNLDLTFLVPLIVLACLKHMQGGFGRHGFITVLSLMLLAELGISAEILATLCVMGALMWWIFFAFATLQDRERLWRLAIDIGIAVAATAVFAGPFLFYMWKGLNATFPIPAGAAQNFSADMLNYLVPTQITEFWRAASPLARRFTGNITEQGAYLGLPLVLIMALYFRETISHRHGRALLMLTGALAMLSCGPWLQIAGWRTDLPLPWWLATHLPLIGLALPARLTLYVSLCAAVIAALWLAKATAKRGRRFGLAGCACLALAPNASAYGWKPWTAWTNWPTATFFTPGHIAQALGHAPNLLILPFGSSGDSLAWQVDAHFQFTLAGGYLNIMPRSQPSVIVDELTRGTAGPNFGDQFTTFCRENEVTAVLFVPGAPAPQMAAIRALHWPEHPDRGVIVVLPPASAQSPGATENRRNSKT